MSSDPNYCPICDVNFYPVSTCPVCALQARIEKLEDSEQYNLKGERTDIAAIRYLVVNDFSEWWNRSKYRKENDGFITLNVTTDYLKSREGR